MAADDFVRSRIHQMIDLYTRRRCWPRSMPWDEPEKTLAPIFVRCHREGRGT